MIPLPGWYCPSCNTWNGTAKAESAAEAIIPGPCRVCGGAYTPEARLGRSELLRVVALLARENVVLYEQITYVQAKCTAYVNVTRAARACVNARACIDSPHLVAHLVASLACELAELDTLQAEPGAC